MRLLTWGAASAALLALAGCSHGSKLYSQQDAKRAFAKEGFVLVPTGREQRVLVPKARNRSRWWSPARKQTRSTPTAH